MYTINIYTKINVHVLIKYVCACAQVCHRMTACVYDIPYQCVWDCMYQQSQVSVTSIGTSLKYAQVLTKAIGNSYCIARIFSTPNSGGLRGDIKGH